MSGHRDEALNDFSDRVALLLGVQAVDRHVAERAAADPLFLHQLILLRKDPDAVDACFEKAAGSWPKWAVPASVQSLARMGVALTRWAAAGFGKVDESTLQKRISACRACPHLQQPSHLVQKLMSGSEQAVCGLCSCAVEKKAILPTETCPAASPESDGVNRWGEPHVA